MKQGIRDIRGTLNTLRRNQRGINGVETAIVLVAFVVVASVFAYAVISTGLFSSEKSQQWGQASMMQAKSTISPKGSMILAEAQSTGTATAAGATMTNAGGDFIVEGVEVGDTIRNVTDGSSATLTAVAATILTGVLTGGAANTWAIADAYEVDMDSVGTIKFKMTPSPGADPVILSSGTTLVSFSDSSNNVNSTYVAAFPEPLVEPAYWNNTWMVGSGPGLEVGEVVEFTVNVKNLTTPLLANKPFSVEIILQTGAAVSYNRVTPLEMAKIMDVN